MVTRVPKIAKVNLPTDEDVECGFEQGRLEHEYDGAKLAFDVARDVLDLTLVNGLRLFIPRSMIPTLAHVAPTSARRMRLDSYGEAIEIASKDIHLSVAGTLRKLVGADIASKGGRARTAAKAAAARTNGRLGGRPPKTVPPRG
jgi:hypothetical protein